MRQIEKSKNVVNPWENGNDITKMSSISVAKHKKKGTPSGEPFFLSAAPALRALLARHRVPRFTVPMRAIRFAFAARRSTSSLVRRRACESQSEAELP